MVLARQYVGRALSTADIRPCFAFSPRRLAPSVRAQPVEILCHFTLNLVVAYPLWQVAPIRVDFPGSGRRFVVKLAAGERHASALTLTCSPPPQGWDKDKQWLKVVGR